jgi:vacuolar-type H+-ATPase subunit I/STV1
MADEEIKKGETPDSGAAGETPATVTAQAATKTLTVEEALAQLEELRKQLSAVNKESAGRRKKIEEIEAAEAKRKQAELSELEQLKAKLAEQEKARLAAESKANEALIRHAVEMAAATMKFHNPEVAYHLLDLAEVSIGEDGKVAGVEDALKKLVKSNPYLVGNGTAAAPETDASKRGIGKLDPKAHEEEIRKRYRITG